MTHEPAPGHEERDQDRLGGGPAAEPDRHGLPDGSVNGATGRPAPPVPPQGPPVPAIPADRPTAAGGDTGAPHGQPVADDDWDPDAALDALVAAVEAGQVAIPPDDSGALRGLYYLAADDGGPPAVEPGAGAPGRRPRLARLRRRPARARYPPARARQPPRRLDQHQPGYHTWTTPSGRTYTTGPTTYPV